MANCGADTEANRLLPSLTQDAVFPIPDVDLSGIVFPDGVLNAEIKKLTVEDITDGEVTGPGAFDALMRGFKAHLLVEWNEGRITGDDYTKAYIALTDTAMSQAISFLMGRDQAYWSTQMLQIQAFSERVAFETAKATLAATQYNAANQKAAYAKTKMDIANAESAYCTSEYNLSTILPLQKSSLEAQTASSVANTDIARYNLNSMLPEQLLLLAAQKGGQDIENDTANYNLTTILPQNLTNLKTQQLLLNEQMEAQHAQTVDTRTNLEPVNGVMGAQRKLYNQQITSYMRDAEMKVAKMYSDSWITQKTIDEGLTAPTNFTNAEIDKVLTIVRANNNLTGV